MSGIRTVQDACLYPASALPSGFRRQLYSFWAPIRGLVGIPYEDARKVFEAARPRGVFQLREERGVGYGLCQGDTWTSAGTAVFACDEREIIIALPTRSLEDPPTPKGIRFYANFTPRVREIDNVIAAIAAEIPTRN